MEKDRQEWIDGVLNSVKGSRRAKPRADLFAQIESNLDAPEVRIIPINQWRISVAAAVLLLVLNVFVLQQYTQNQSINTSEFVTGDSSEQNLVSNYNIYD